jgi:hypothetical protein
MAETFAVETCSGCGIPLIDKETGLVLTTVLFEDGKVLCWTCFTHLPEEV